MRLVLPPIDRHRLLGGAAAIAVQVALGWALIAGLSVHFRDSVDRTLAVFGVIDSPPPPPAPKPRANPKPDPRKEGASSPVNLRSRATQVVAPPPVVPLIVPPPVIAAPKANVGSDATTGSADIRGPGTGAGGIGEGTGSGGSGDGDGGGGYDTPPRWRSGSLRNSDYPEDAAERGLSGTVGVRYLVAVNGRVPECEVTRSSGSVELDTLTCALIRKRFRFAPSRDERGRPVPSYIVENHTWDFERIAPER